ncbi:MAG: glycoside hydrolase family 16 protein [Gemmataceae bacterium]
MRILLLTPLVLLAGLIANNDAAQPAAEWKLTWSDEFDGNEIDRAKWDFDIGNGFYNYDANQWISGWGNNELQYYTKEPENAFVKDGKLHIRAIKESLHNCGWSSARLKTHKKDGTALFAQTYGKFEFRAKLPTGKGVWPALWMLPASDKYGAWASSGEIDVMEARGQEPNKVLGTLHFGSQWPNNSHSGGEHEFEKGTSIAEFHTYAVEWLPGEIRWFVDGKEFAKKASWWSSKSKPTKATDLNAWPAPFDQPFYLVMNVAVGGRFVGGNPDKTTPFPATMEVDWVRVYEKPGGYGPVKPRGEGAIPFEK